MVDVVNSVNINNSAPAFKSKPVVGVVPVPDSHPKDSFYSDAEAHKKFKALNHELEHASGHVEYTNKKKTYIGVAISIGIVASAIFLAKKNVGAKIKNLKNIKIKDAFKNFSFSGLKNIFKRKP